MRDALTRSRDEARPVKLESCREAAPGDLLDWLERIAARLVREYAGGTPPRYLMQSRERVRAEIERRMARGS